MRIAVTGGVAEGKSTVLGYLEALGYSTASADVEARALLASEAYQRLVADQFHLSLPLTPAAVRQAIFESVENRRWLNAVLHEPIMNRLFASGAEFLEIPLLYEACLQGEFDKVWVVTCGPEEQHRRLAARLQIEREVSLLLASQLPTAIKVLLADRIVRTNRPESHVLRYVTESVLCDRE